MVPKVSSEKVEDLLYIFKVVYPETTSQAAAALGALMSLVDKAAAVAHKTVATGLVLMSTAGLAYIGLGSYDIWYRSRQNKAAKEAAAAKA